MCATDLGYRVYKGAEDDSTSISLFAKAMTAHFNWCSQIKVNVFPL